MDACGTLSLLVIAHCSDREGVSADDLAHSGAHQPPVVARELTLAGHIPRNRSQQQWHAGDAADAGLKVALRRRLRSAPSLHQLAVGDIPQTALCLQPACPS